MRALKYRQLIDGIWHYWGYGIDADDKEGRIFTGPLRTADVAPSYQYTGLTDRNGKEIYEGDILKDEHGVGEVEWVQEHCAYRIFTRNPSVYHAIESDSAMKNTEVIGNTYQHPHLLKE